jgi:hypothetical protein
MGCGGWLSHTPPATLPFFIRAAQHLCPSPRRPQPTTPAPRSTASMATQWTDEERAALWTLACEHCTVRESDSKSVVDWTAVAKSFGDLGYERSKGAVMAHFKIQCPEGAEPKAHKGDYGSLEDAELLTLVNEHCQHTAKGGRAKIDWAAVELGMKKKGYAHSLSGLKTHLYATTTSST